MGAIQEPTAEMRNWHNETRTESWWLTRDGNPGDAASVDKAARTFTFPQDEADAVLAALYQAEECANALSAATSPDAGRGWTLERQADGLLTLSGPFVLLGRDAYGDDEDGPEYLRAEIEYADLDELYELVRDAAVHSGA